MAEPTSPAGSVRGLTRRVAQRQVQAVERYDEALQRYAASLRRYADGQIDGTELGKDMLSVAVEQTARGVEDLVEIGAEYSRWAWSLAGVQVRDEPAEADEPKGGKSGATKSTKSTSAGSG